MIRPYHNPKLSSQLIPRSVTNFTPTIHKDTYPFIPPAKSNLSGKSVLITGTSFIAVAARSWLSGIAQEVRDSATRAGHPEPTVLTLNLDVTDRASVDAAATAVSSAFDDTLDILVTNAGYLSSFTSIAASDPDEW
jgi:NAD(P)-dependent dehydrogenase (short-subunit alcohol dehydrogenase family)